MTFKNQLVPAAPSRSLSSTVVYISIIFLLSTYVTVDFFKQHSSEFRLESKSGLSESDQAPSKLAATVVSAAAAASAALSTQPAEDDVCSSVFGHLPEHRSSQQQEADPWDQTKWIGKPARCRVKGELIENLDEHYNFRRGYALKFTADVEDKTHLLPWLLGSKVNLNARERRVYLDLGANAFETSIQWFMRWYPCDFTEVHAFEIDPQLLKLPEVEFAEDDNLEVPNPRAIVAKQTPGIPNWMLQRMTFYNQLVSDADDNATKAVNITRFMKETLNLSASDTVVVKMDIESAEWPILQRWLQDPQMADIVDELFVEIHYQHPSMSGFLWDSWAPRTRDQASYLLASLRSKGFFVHPWP